MPSNENAKTAEPRWKRWVNFFTEDVWRFDFSELTRVRKSALQALQVLLLVSERFFKDRLMLRAGALTYTTMLSIVPLLAFMFAVLKGLGVQRRLEPIVLERVAVGSQEIVTRLMNYIDKVKVGSLGAVGLVLLVVSIILVIDNVENAFNDIWSITARRTYLRKFSDYLALMTVAPLFLLLAISVTASLKSLTLVTWLKFQPGLGPLVVLGLRLVPYAAIWFVLTFLYMFLPNTRVKLAPAFLAGALTGTVWQLTQWFYVTFQVGVSRYNAIYGTLAQLPVMLVWIYISWVIVLFGGELTFALQNVHAYRRERKCGELHFLARVELAWGLLREVHARFASGLAPWTADGLSRVQRVPASQVRQVLEELEALGYVLPVKTKDDPAYVPALDFSNVPVVDVLENLEHSQAGGHAQADKGRWHPTRVPPAGAPERDWIKRLRESRRRALQGVMLVGSGGKPPAKKRIR
jgi:membrane protein